MKPKKMLLLSTLSSLLTILYCFFQWKIIALITAFMILPVLLMVFGFFITMTVLAFISLFKNSDWKPLVIQVITIILLFTIPFNQIVLDMDFKMNKSEREKVARMVEQGTLKPNVKDSPSLIHLPKQYQGLSDGGGDIVVEKTGNGYNILFFTYRGILDNFSGFVYIPNDQKPSKKAFDGDFKEINKVDKNWYFVSSN